MSKKRKRTGRESPVWHRSAEQVTLDAMPKYNPYAIGHGVHGDVKYNRAKERNTWKREQRQEGASRGPFLMAFSPRGLIPRSSTFARAAQGLFRHGRYARCGECVGTDSRCRRSRARLVGLARFLRERLCKARRGCPVREDLGDLAIPSVPAGARGASSNILPSISGNPFRPSWRARTRSSCTGWCVKGRGRVSMKTL